MDQEADIVYYESPESQNTRLSCHAYMALIAHVEIYAYGHYGCRIRLMR